MIKGPENLSRDLCHLSVLEIQVLILELDRTYFTKKSQFEDFLKPFHNKKFDQSA